MGRKKDEYLTVEEYAKLRGVTSRWVYLLMAAGDLPYVEKYGKRLIERTILEAK